MKKKKYNKEEMKKIVEKHKEINKRKRELEGERKFVNDIIEVCEQIFQLNKYK